MTITGGTNRVRVGQPLLEVGALFDGGADLVLETLQLGGVPGQLTTERPH